MIQRIQTVYLSCIVLIVALLMAGAGGISEGAGTRNNLETHYSITFLQTEFTTRAIETHFNIPVLISLGLCLLMALFTIFQYKNLKFQKRLCGYNFVLIVVAYICILYQYFSVTTSFSEMWETHFSYGLILSLTLILFNFLAFRGIRKDIDTLASADRLR